MSSIYVVQKGDFLVKIASAHGFSDWRTIHNHPENAPFRVKRPNPNLIYPGDQLVIPDSGGPARPPAPVVLLVVAKGATRVDGLGNQAITHFVTPKATGVVALAAIITPNLPTTRSQVSWEGAAQNPDNPLEAIVPRTAPGKRVVKLKVNGVVVEEIRVWVVWTSLTTVTDVPIVYTDSPNVQGGRPGGFITGGFRFTHRMLPTEIFTDADRPDLGGANTVPPPGGIHPFNGGMLANGADRRWDSSRQIRAKFFNPANIALTDFAQPFPVNIPAYPVNDVEGNDDRSTADENNDPYTNVGVLQGFDSPAHGVVHAAGKDGDTWEWRLNFREFTRLELNGKWHRISDYFPWRISIRLKKVGGKWINDGTNKATDNAGF